MWPSAQTSKAFGSLSSPSPAFRRSINRLCALKRPRNLIRKGVGVGLASLSLAGLWSPEHRERLSIGVDGSIRTTRTFTTGCACIADYKLLHLRYKSCGYGTEEFKAARRVVHARCAQRILDLCKKNGGIFIKAGQHIASLNPMVPVEYTKALSVLQDRAPFRPLDQMEIVFRAEFDGQGPRDLFAEFDEQPIAAASIAQVHRARTHSGNVVAVKMQYEDVSRLFSTDMWTLQTLSDLTSQLFPDFELSWIVAEFCETVEKEFDFRNEARNAERTADRFAHRKHELKVPKILWEYTTKRVLTMEFVQGVKVNDVEGIKAMGIDPRWVGRLLLEVFAEMIFCHGVFHGDPHAGNAFVSIDPTTHQPQLVLLDHGLYRQLSTSFRLSYCLLWRSLLLNDPVGLHISASQLGVGQYAPALSFIFTGRAPDSTMPLGHELSAADRRAARRRLSREIGMTINDVLVFLEHLPREMLFVFRVSHMVNALHRELGGWKGERFEVNAVYAIMGSWCETAEEMSTRRRSMMEGIGPWKKAWWLFGGAPDLARSVGYLRDMWAVRWRMWMLEVMLSMWQWWNQAVMAEDVIDANVAKVV